MNPCRHGLHNINTSVRHLLDYTGFGINKMPHKTLLAFRPYGSTQLCVAGQIQPFGIKNWCYYNKCFNRYVFSVYVHRILSVFRVSAE